MQQPVAPRDELADLVSTLRRRAEEDPALLPLANEADGILASATRARREVEDNALRALKALVHHAQPLPVEEEFITMGQAASILNCSIETATKHVQRHGLGRKIDGRWRVSKPLLLAYCRGKLPTAVR